MTQSKLNVSKVTLSSGKVVLLREPKIRDQEFAAIAASPKSKGDQNLLGLFAAKEMLKCLIVQIDGRAIRPVETEDLDSLFSPKEYGQLMKVMGQLMEGDDGGKYQIEAVSSGDI
jgi:hypothetical protein